MTCGCAEVWDRRRVLKALTSMLAVAGCAPVSSAHRDAAQRLAQESLSVDLHSHSGLVPSATTGLDRHVDRIVRGQLKASLFSAVSDGPLLRWRPGSGLSTTREPRAGELYDYTYRSLAAVTSRVAGGALALVERPQDLGAAVVRGRPGALIAVEGGDFLEGRIERVQEAYDRGIRSIQLTHYRINELGDIQTAAPHHGGLTSFGLDVIREMNRLGMIVDVAHLTYDGVRAAVSVSTKPLLLSHTIVDVPWARAVTTQHARLVSERGGVIGVFPVNIGYYGLTGYVEHIARMIDAVGLDHVGVGTDMDGILPASFTAFDDYREWPSLVATLLAHGYSREDVSKVTGGNFLRVFQEVAAV